MKIYISIDMEGLWGLSSWSEDKQDIKRAITRELKVVLGALEKSTRGKLNVLVADSHSYGENLIMEELPDYVEVIRGYPRKFYMMHGLDETFDACMFIGYHAPCGLTPGQMDHTYSSSSIFKIEINGRSVGESEINALLAGHFNVPVILISGDNQLFNFSKKNFPKTQFVITKYAISKFAARMRPWKEVVEEYKTKVRKAVENIEKISPIKWEPPYTVEIELLDTSKAYTASIIPGAALVDGRKVSFSSSDFKDIYRFIMSTSLIAWAARKS